MWTIAKIRDGFADLPNERFHTFAIKFDGKVVGELKWKYRHKTEGGPAWRGTLFKLSHGMDVCFYAKDKQQVLAWFKTQNLG